MEDEEGSEYIENLLLRAEKEEIIVFIAFISLTEVFYITIQEKGESEAIRRIKLVKSLAVRTIESNE